MSEENVELVRAHNDAFRRGDWEAVAANLDEHVLVRPDPSWPERYIYGRAAVVAWLQGVHESLGPNMRIAETRDLADRVMLCFEWELRGSASGIEGELRWTELVTVRNNRLIFTEMFLDHSEALRELELDQ